MPANNSRRPSGIVLSANSCLADGFLGYGRMLRC
jgi:hypothetical protein